MLRLAALSGFLAISLFGQRNVPIDNEFVRVLSVVDAHVDKPGSIHEHKQNRVMIYLDPANINLRYTDPANVHKNEDQRWKAGDIAWSPAGGLHTSQHVSAAPSRIIEIELRKGVGNSVGSPTKGAALENDQVRVYRSATAPPAGSHYIAVDLKTSETLWDRLPSGSGPFVITLLK